MDSHFAFHFHFFFIGLVAHAKEGWLKEKKPTWLQFLNSSSRICICARSICLFLLVRLGEFYLVLRAAALARFLRLATAAGEA